MNHNYKTTKDYVRLWDKHKDSRLVGFDDGSFFAIVPSRLEDKETFLEWCEDLDFIDPEPENIVERVKSMIGWMDVQRMSADAIVKSSHESEGKVHESMKGEREAYARCIEELSKILKEGGHE